MRSRIAPARQAALTVLEQVAQGSYASDLLREATAHLAMRDAALTNQLVLGSLRVQNQLDYLIQHYSLRPANSLDLTVLLALRLAIYQIRYLQRVPAHAAVNDSVEFVKAHRRAASGLANAVLRKVNREPIPWPSEDLEYACPAWLLNRWKLHFGGEAALAIARAALFEPEPYIRIRSGDPLPEKLELQPTSVPGCYKLLSPVTGDIRLHDIGSQAVVPLLELAPQHSYLDLCAAPGNKTSQALESRPYLAIACDIGERRLRALTSNLPRVVLDASEQLPFNRAFDRIFLDAPCSGTGTLGRNPEIKWRLQKSELARHHARQVNILKRASAVLASGGKILYATCSLEQEENEDVVREATAQASLGVERETWRLPGQQPGDGFYAALLSRI